MKEMKVVCGVLASLASHDGYGGFWGQDLFLVWGLRFKVFKLAFCV